MVKEQSNEGFIIFDGQCNFCNYWVRWLIKRDRQDQFRFVMIQNFDIETRRQLFPDRQESVVFLDQQKVFSKSAAVLQIINQLGGFWRLLLFFKLLPGKWRDGIYVFVARNRYRWFGKKDACPIMPANLSHKFPKSIPEIIENVAW